MAKHTTGKGTAVGLDLGDRESSYCALDCEGEVVERGKAATTGPALEKLFRRLGKGTVVLEVGTHSPWVSRLLKDKGQRVVVANPRQLPLITRSQRKNDRNDAETLARLGRLDETLLSPVQHRGEQAQEHRAIIQSRAQLVAQRAALINHIRGTVKAHGERLPSSSAPAFPRKMAALIPDGLRSALLPLLELIEQQTETIGHYDRQVERLAKEVYPESALLRQVTGVGALTALTYVLTLEEKGRFKRSRQVGAYLGLVPRQQESGERRPELHVTKAGDSYLRTLLVQCAHYIVGPFGPDTKLRRWGLKLAGEGSTARKKRALIAVARKLAVLLHRLWVSGEVYEPFYGEEQPIAA
jgi:transposase